MSIFESISKKIEQREQGIKMSDLLDLPTPLRKLMTRVVRTKTLTLAEAAAHLSQSEAAVQAHLELLMEKGYLQYDGLQQVYRVRYGRTDPKIKGSLWALLDDKLRPTDAP